MSLILFTDALFGNDNAGGSSEGSPKASGTDAVVTSGNQTIDLSGDSPSLSTAVSGDTIRISGSTDGINSSDIFEISAVDDGTDTVTVVQTPGSSVSGLTWAVGGAFQTIQRAVEFLDSGDKLWIKASATYSETISVQRVALSTQPIVVEGYLSITGDLGIPEINGGGTILDGWRSFEYLTGAADFFVLRNLRFTNFTNAGLNGEFTTNVRVDRCRFDNNGNYGCRLAGIAIYSTCYFHDNGIHGSYPRGSNNYHLSCIANDNTQDGIRTGDQGMCLGCLLTGNLSKNILVDSTVTRTLIINCTIDGKDQTSEYGIDVGSLNTGGLSVLNNIVVGCVSGMISATPITWSTFSLNNLLFNNTTNYSLFGTQTGEVLADPLFVDADGFDYSLRSNSPALGAGLGLSSQRFVPFSNPLSQIGAYLESALASDETTDTFGLGIERLLFKQDHYPQMIGRFDGSESGVTIRVWDIIDAANNELILTTADCYAIGDTGRWGWSTQYLPPPNTDLKQYFYQMATDNAQVFDGSFTLNSNFILPNNINDYIRLT